MKFDLVGKNKERTLYFRKKRQNLASSELELPSFVEMMGSELISIQDE
jgi:hypothetical protein